MPVYARNLSLLRSRFRNSLCCPSRFYSDIWVTAWEDVGSNDSTLGAQKWDESGFSQTMWPQKCRGGEAEKLSPHKECKGVPLQKISGSKLDNYWGRYPPDRLWNVTKRITFYQDRLNQDNQTTIHWPFTIFTAIAMHQQTRRSDDREASESDVDLQAWQRT